MRFFLLFIMCIATIHSHNNLIGQTVSGTESNVQKKSTITYDQIQQIIRQIKDKSIPFEKILPKIKQLEPLSSENLYWYLKTMRDFIETVRYARDKDEMAMATGRIIIDKAAFIVLDESTESNTARRCDALYTQMCMLLTYEYRFRRTELLIDCEPEERHKYASRLIELYQLIVSQIEEDYDPYASENNFITGQNFIPPPSYRGHIIIGMDMSDVEDEATREAYKKYREDETAILNKRTAQEQSLMIRKHYPKSVMQYLVDAYSLFPYRTSELEAMLTKHKFDTIVGKEILDAVRKVEKEHPDDGFRIWLSNDKLFKSESKFVSANSKAVVLERRDGKRATIELSALRKEDQDYIKGQLAPKPAKPQTDSLP